MNQDNYSVTAQISQEKSASKLENLPAELLNQKRFFPVRITNDGHKVPTIKAWQKLENQMTAYEAIKETGLIGMDICGHGVYPDFFFVDFDHVKDQCGNFLYDDAERWNNYLQIAETFNERSFSKDGTHYLFCPSPNKFPALTGEPNHAIYFDKDKKGKGAPKIELFYCSGRYILLTGDSAPNMEIISGVEADEFCQQLCNQIALDTSHIKDVANACAGAQIDSDVPIEEVKKILAVIPCAKVTYADWFKAAAILHYHYGEAGFEIWRAWSETDPDRYTLEACQRQWDYIAKRSALKVGRPATIGSLIFCAKQFGYQPKRKRADRADVYNDSRADARNVEDIIADIRDYQCEWKVNKKGERLYILPTSRNIRTIFNNDPNLKNLIGYDEFNGTIALTKRPAWSHYKRFTPEWTDTDDAQLRMYLRENYAEFQADKLITQAVISISQERIFNAVKNYFARLPKWDGTPRAETLFIKYLRVEDTPYAREITLNWLIAAVARIYEPGCRYQTALVLQGAQGIGKSYIIELLGGKWYLELTDSVDDSHASDAIKKGWIVELKEMAAMRKAEINAVKAFIERASEKRREPYAKIATETPRHCVFAITVNDSEFLRDQTGNRRYMILKCNSEKLGYVDGLTVEEIKQVWAEVLVKYNEMFKDGFDEKKLSLSRETALKAEEVATRYLQDDGMAGEVKAFLDKKILPQYIWQLLTREERRKFFADGRLVLPDGLADLNKRRRARGGKEDIVQHDVNLISGFLNGVAGKNFVRRNEIKRGDDTITEYIAYGSEYRQHICAAEIFNECFGSDKRKSMYRINEIFINLDGWTLGARLRNTDSVYFDQRKPYYRDADNIPDKTRNEEQEDRDDYYNEPIDPTDTPF